ncbi:MAG: hypothetical protein M1828_002734 [Chrysothrix sp. TS-e1954]|nr:MAG: hypothetical protein M1828_002734 [Chrysothrix sp. TS-e1954]
MPAPTLGRLHQLVARNVKLLRSAWNQVRQNQATRGAVLEPIPIRSQQPIHPIAALKQSRTASKSIRWYTTHTRALEAAVRRYTTSNAPQGAFKYDRTLFPKSRTATAVNSLTGRTPFASTLRPNLTGGALPRTAGGYGLGSGRTGGARFFSHTPASQAQVVQNVSQAVRAFILGGQKAQFDGRDAKTGEKRYLAVTTLQDTTMKQMSYLPKATPGSYVQFTVNPTITALAPLCGVAGFSNSSESALNETAATTLNTDGLLNVLSADFSRALKDLAAVLHDLQTLSSLGDLPITYRDGNSLRIHFPGCDAETVEGLCKELDVRRGLVVQDEDFDAFVGTEMALLFPFAPNEGSGIQDVQNAQVEYDYDQEQAQWNANNAYSTQSEDSLSLDQGFEYLVPSHHESPEDYGSMPGRKSAPSTLYSPSDSPLEYRDFEGIYRFIELCDDARGPQRQV